MSPLSRLETVGKSAKGAYDAFIRRSYQNQKDSEAEKEQVGNTAANTFDANEDVPLPSLEEVLIEEEGEIPHEDASQAVEIASQLSVGDEAAKKQAEDEVFEELKHKLRMAKTKIKATERRLEMAGPDVSGAAWQVILKQAKEVDQDLIAFMKMAEDARFLKVEHWGQLSPAIKEVIAIMKDVQKRTNARLDDLIITKDDDEEILDTGKN